MVFPMVALVPVLSVLAVGQGTPLTAPVARRLSLSEAVQLAQTRSPLSRAGEARVAGAEARLKGAGALPNPVLTLAQPFGRNTGGLDEGTVLTDTFELGDKRRQRIRASRGERDAFLADRSGVGLDLAFNAQSAYFEALRAEAEKALAVAALQNAQAFAKAAEIGFAAGDVARSNVVRGQIELSRAEIALRSSETERVNRYAALRSLLQLPENTELTLTDSLEFSPQVYSLPSLLTLAVDSRPDVRSARKLREARKAALHGARAQSQPDLLIEARRSTLDPTVGGNSLRVGVVFPLFDFGRIRSDSNSAKAALQEQEAALEETLRAAKLEVETASRTLEGARQTVASFRDGRLERSRELLEMTQLGYQKGANTYLELLDAQQVFRTEQTDYARALAAYNTARATLQRAVGGKLPQ